MGEGPGMRVGADDHDVHSYQYLPLSACDGRREPLVGQDCHLATGWTTWGAPLSPDHRQREGRLLFQAIVVVSCRGPQRFELTGRPIAEAGVEALVVVDV